MAFNQQEAQFTIRARQIGMQTVDAAAASVAKLTETIRKQTDMAAKGDVSAKAMADSLGELQSVGEKIISQVGLVDRYKDLAAALEASQAKAQVAKDKQDAYGKTLTGTTDLTAKQTREQTKLNTSVKNANEQVVARQEALAKQAELLARVGISTNDLAGAEERLRSLSTQTSAAISAAGEVLDGYSDHLARLKKQAEAAASVETFKKISGDAQRAVEAAQYANWWSEALAKVEVQEKATGQAQVEASKQQAIQTAAMEQTRKETLAAAEALYVFQSRGVEVAALTAKFDKFAGAVGMSGSAASAFGSELNSILDPSGSARATLSGLEKQVGELTTLIGAGDKPIRTYAGALNSLSAVEGAIAGQGRLIESFINQKAAVAEADAAYQKSLAAVKDRTAAVASANAPDKELIANLRQEQSELSATSAALVAENAQLAELSAKMQKAGISTSDLGGAQARLRKTATDAAEATAKLQKANAGGDGKFLGLRPYDFTNLMYQINDVATGIASGQPALQILAQQGGQFAQIPGFLSAIVAYVPAIIALVVVFGSLFAVAERVVSLKNDIRDFNKELSSTADVGLYNATALAKTAQALRDYGDSSDEAKKSIQDFIKAGVDPSRIMEFGVAAKNMARVLGIDVPTASKMLADGLTGSYEALARFDEQTDVFTVSQRAAIRALFDAGEADKGRALALEIASTKYQTVADKSRSDWAIALRDLGDAWRYMLDQAANTEFVQRIERNITVLGQWAKIAGEHLWGDHGGSGKWTGSSGQMVGYEGSWGGGTLAGGKTDGSPVRDTTNQNTAAGAEIIRQIQDETTLTNKLADATAQVAVVRRQAYEAAIKGGASDPQAVIAGNLKAAQKQKELDQLAADERLQLQQRVLAGLQQAASGQDADLGLRLDAVKAKFQDAFDAIALAKSKGFDPKYTTQAEAQLKALEGQALQEETLKFYEQQLADLQKTRADAQKSAAEALAAHSITAEAAAKRISDINGQITPKIQATAAAALAFARGLANAKIDPKIVAFAQMASTAGADAKNGSTSEQLKIYEGGVTGAQADQTSGVKGVMDQYNNQDLDPQAALQKIIDLSKTLGDKTAIAAKNAEDFAKSLKGAQADPSVMAFIAKMQNVQHEATSSNDKTGTGKDEHAILTGEESTLNELVAKRNDLEKAYQDLVAAGLMSTDEEDAKRKKLYADTTPEIQKQIDLVNELIKTLRDQPGADAEALDAVAAKVTLIGAQATYVNKDVESLGKTIQDSFAHNAVSAFDAAGTALVAGVTHTEHWRQAIQDLEAAAGSFFAGFLKDIANAILQIEAMKLAESIFGPAGGGSGGGASAGGATGIAALILGSGSSSSAASMAAQTAGGDPFSLGAEAAATGGSAASSGVWGTILDYVGSLFHEGTGGNGSMRRSGPSMNPALWANAPRYHTGTDGAGLNANEMRAVINKGEAVLTEDDPAHPLNRRGGGSGAAAQPQIKQTLVLDSNDITGVMASSAGAKVTLTHIKAYVPTIKQMLGVK